ncbi:potassium-transporting ATPase subunit F [Bacteroides fragilis]
MPASGYFGNALTGLKQFREENLFYVHNTICSRYHTFSYLTYVLIRPEKF